MTSSKKNFPTYSEQFINKQIIHFNNLSLKNEILFINRSYSVEGIVFELVVEKILGEWRITKENIYER
jgi:hypothetical protein